MLTNLNDEARRSISEGLYIGCTLLATIVSYKLAKRNGWNMNAAIGIGAGAGAAIGWCASVPIMLPVWNRSQ